MARWDSQRVLGWLIVAGVLFGVALRVGWAVHSRFGNDIATAYATAFDMVHRRVFPIEGGASTWGGHLALPGYWYLCVPPLLVTDSPRAFMWWGALFCSLGLVPFAKMLSERYGREAAAFGIWFAATAPFSVICTDAPWSPKMALPFVALLLYALHRVVAVPRSRWSAVVPLALAGQAHSYPALPATLAMALAVWAICRPRVSWRWLAAGCLAAALTVLPTAVHVLDPPAEPARPAQGQSVHHRFDRVRSAWLSVQYTALFPTSFAKYGSFGKAGRADANVSWMRAHARKLKRLFGGWHVVGFATLSLMVVLFGWVRAGWHALVAVRTTPSRAWDPMAVAFVAGVVASALVAAFGARMFIPRYGYLILWASFLPVLWLCWGHRPLRGPCLRAAVMLFLIVAVPTNLWITRRVYTRDVSSSGVRTALASMRRIAHEERGRPFALQKMPGWLRAGWDLVGERLYPSRWNRHHTAAVGYSLIDSPRSRRDRRQLGQLRKAGVRILPVTGGVLLRRELGAPARRRPSAGARRGG